MGSLLFFGFTRLEFTKGKCFWRDSTDSKLERLAHELGCEIGFDTYNIWVCPWVAILLAPCDRESREETRGLEAGFLIKRWQVDRSKQFWAAYFISLFQDTSKHLNHKGFVTRAIWRYRPSYIKSLLSLLL